MNRRFHTSRTLFKRHLVLITLALIAAFSPGYPLLGITVPRGMGGINPVIGQVGKTPITIQDVEDKQINELRAELHKRLQGKLQLLALQKLATENAEYNLDYQPTIPESMIRQFFDANALQSRGSYDELKSRIQSLLQMQALSEHYNRLYAKAVDAGLIVSYLQQPNEFLIRIPVGTAYVWGGSKEKVMVLEFSDYQCPFCSRIQSTIKELRETYLNRVAFGYRHSPLAFHQEADEAAIAVECARDQNKFTEYHNILFANYRVIHPGKFEPFAREAGIPDIKQFNSCVTSEKYRSRVEADQNAATEIGIRGTPGFIIGKYDQKTGIVTGEILSGAQPKTAFTSIIDKYLN